MGRFRAEREGGPPLVSRTAVPIAPVRWRRSQEAETVASGGASAACYRSLENFGVVSVVVAELELRNVQRQVFLADLVISADNAALHQRPEALNRLSVDSANDVLFSGMVNDGVGVFLPERFVADPRIRAEQTYPVRN